MKKIPQWVIDYMSILGLEREVPSYSFLEKICRAHLTTFPFENISKLIYYRDQVKNNFIIPTPDILVNHFNQYHFGGTCYTLNSNLFKLLQELGFSCHLVKLGQVQHMGIIVKLSELFNERVYIDCGAAAPIFKPVRIETDENNVSAFGDDQVKIVPNKSRQGSYTYARYIQGTQRGDSWEFDLNQEYDVIDFHAVINKANQPNTTFMTILRCQLWQLDKNRSVSLVNNKFSIRYTDGSVKDQTLCSIEEIEDVIENQFLLSKLSVREAIYILEDLGVDIFAE